MTSQIPKISRNFRKINAVRNLETSKFQYLVILFNHLYYSHVFVWYI